MWSVLYDPELRPAYLAFEKEYMDICANILKKTTSRKRHDETLDDRARLFVGAATMLTKLALDNSDPKRNEDYVRHVMGVLLQPVE
jgi:hypothetical protein